MLHDCRLAAANGQNAFSHPADGRPEGHTIETDFAFGAEVFHRRPDRVVIDLLHANIVELHDVDAFGANALQCGIRGSPQIGG